jgi:hypothetical protein
MEIAASGEGPGDVVNAAIISGFPIVITGMITQNAWLYWHRKRLRWLSAALDVSGTLLLVWGAVSAHRGYLAAVAVVLAGVTVLDVAATLAFVSVMAGVRHQGWMLVVKRMTERSGGKS